MRLRLRYLSVECAQHQGDNWVKRGAGNETVSGEWKQGENFWGRGRISSYGTAMGYHPGR